MQNRVAYPEAVLFGSTPSLIDRSGPAAREIAAIAQEIDDARFVFAQVTASVAPDVSLRYLESLHEGD